MSTESPKVFDNDLQYTTIPGRGLVTAYSTKLRLDYLDSLNIETDEIANSPLQLPDIQKNIESYIGSVEIPVGIVGPLLFNNDNNPEMVYCTPATLEGALISSMNRGAKAISLSGGFKAKITWQRMNRAPMFLFENEEQALIFSEFSKRKFNEIKAVAETYSNHAKLQEIDVIRVGTAVNLIFFYTTGDASGQNMTTSCTWHAMLFIASEFTAETGIVPLDFIIDGNGSSDKKVAEYSIRKGRGVRVEAECFLPENVINTVLRTSSEKIIRCFQPSADLAKRNGMVGYNINVVNAIASIYAATGQDLACIAESSTGFLEIENTGNGLKWKLLLPNLIIGTIGGGTHLSKQSQALEIMGCKGTGKVERFAKLIAGFALGLDISTYSAIVSGEFAKAHEKLGRNKPVDCLLRSELSDFFLNNIIKKGPSKKQFETIEPVNDVLMENGIITHITSRVSKKLMGFVPLKAVSEGKETRLLLKSKALDIEVIKGLHMLAASIDPTLSDLIYSAKENLEYKNCHTKEIEIYEFLDSEGFKYIPGYFGKIINPPREIFIFIQEFLTASELRLANSDMTPEQWAREDIHKVISVAVKFHKLFEKDHKSAIPGAFPFKAWESTSLYHKLLEILEKEETDTQRLEDLTYLSHLLNNMEEMFAELEIPMTLVHNDFNPRNLAIRSSGEPVVYDWELAVRNIPHRDIAEFLSFVLPENFELPELKRHLQFHHSFYPEIPYEKWEKGYVYALLETLVTRLSFYEVAGILVKYDFSKRVFTTALKMLKMLKNNG